MKIDKVKFNKLKVRVLNKLGKLLLGNLASNIIEKTKRSIIESYKTLEPHIEKIHKIRESQVEYHKLPEEYPIYFRREKAFSDRYIFELKNIILSCQTGLIWTPDHLILQESIGSLRKMLSWNDVRPYINLKVQKASTESKYKYYFLPYKSFFHFVMEEIPALLHVHAMYPDTLKIFIRGGKMPGYYQQFLTMLYQEEYERRVNVINNNVALEKLLLVQKEAYSGFVFSEDIQLLNKYIPVAVKNTPAKIYISRSRTKARRLENETALEAVLKEKEFTILFLEDMSLTEQIETVTNADLIVAPHGAGLTHLVWGDKRKKVIEIFPDYTTNDCYTRMCAQKNYQYSYVVCKAENGNQIIPIEEVINQMEKIKDAEVLS